jgi:hypothetical protein
MQQIQYGSLVEYEIRIWGWKKDKDQIMEGYVKVFGLNPTANKEPLKI